MTKHLNANILKIISYCLIILFIGLINTSVAYNEDYSYVLTIDSQEIGTGQLSDLNYITVDSVGNIYVSNFSNNRIQKLNITGKCINQWGSYGNDDGQFNGPVGVAVDSLDNLYVADFYNCRIQKFNSSGVYVTQWGASNISDGMSFKPVDIAVDSWHNVYVSDYDSNRIVKFNSDGKFIRQWGSYGRDNGLFNNPRGIAVDSADNIYIVDSGNSRIQKFDRSGIYLKEWGTFGKNNTQLNNPKGIAVDSLNNVYVVDSGNHRVLVFDSEGDYLSQFGSYGNNIGQFLSPVDVSIAYGIVFVSDDQLDTIQLFVNNNYYGEATTPDLNLSPPNNNNNTSGSSNKNDSDVYDKNETNITPLSKEEFLKINEREAKLTFNPTEKMTVCDPETVNAYITTDISQNISQVYELNKPLQSKNITITPKVRVTLTGESGAFKVENLPPNSSDVQDIFRDKPTKWGWQVTPLKPGKYKLFLCVEYVIPLNDGSYENYRTLKDIEEEINVESKLNPFWYYFFLSVTMFISGTLIQKNKLAIKESLVKFFNDSEVKKNMVVTLIGGILVAIVGTAIIKWLGLI